MTRCNVVGPAGQLFQAGAEQRGQFAAPHPRLSLQLAQESLHPVSQLDERFESQARGHALERVAVSHQTAECFRVLGPLPKTFEFCKGLIEMCPCFLEKQPEESGPIHGVACAGRTERSAST